MEKVKKIIFGSVTDNKAVYKIGNGQKDYSRTLKLDEAIPYIIHRSIKYRVNITKKTIVADNSKISTIVFTPEQLRRMSLGLSNPMDNTNYLLTDGKKICKCCNVSKDALEYHKNKGLKDNLDSTCKSCKTKRAQAAKKRELA